MGVMAKKPHVWTAKRIRALRLRLGLSQAAAAAKVGVTQRQWAHWEYGTRVPSGPAAVLLDLLDRGIL